MTQLADELLVSYTDGQMSAAQADAVRSVLDSDPETAARVNALEVTRQHLAEAFAAMLPADYAPAPKPAVSASSSMVADQITPPSPAPHEDLLDEAFEAEAVRASEEFETSQATLDDEVCEDAFWDEEDWDDDPNTVESAGWGITLTAGLLGIWLAGAATGYFLYEGIAKVHTPAIPVRATKAPRQDMLTLAANAHTLFRRENLEISAPAQGNATLMAFHLAKIFNQEMPVPDLEQHQLSFKRAQILNLGRPFRWSDGNDGTPATTEVRRADGPVAQISYLGESGGPISLYVTPGQGARAISKTRAGRVNAVAWAQDGLKFVLAGDLPHWHLIVLAATIQRQTEEAGKSGL